MRLKYVFILALLLCVLSSLSAAEQIRTALVIGNSAYSGSPLKNPVNDARAMERSLSQLGFQVTLATDVKNFQDMRRLIRDFGEELLKGGVGLFYYAGHGVQVDGKNYLIPTQAEIRNEGDVELEAVDLERVLNEMQYARNDINIIILDACRDNPYAATFRSSQRGLATITRSVPDCLIAFATQPNGVALDGDGNNGIFTEELLKNISTPGLSITQIMMRTRNGVRQRTKDAQLPWETNLLSDDFYLTEAPQTSQPVQTPPVEDTLSKGLIAYYPFNGNANDESGKGKHGKAYNSTLTTGLDGNTSGAYRFVGSGATGDKGGHIIIPTHDFKSLGDFSVSLWFREEAMTYSHGEGYIWFGDHNNLFWGICHFDGKVGLYYKDGNITTDYTKEMNNTYVLYTVTFANGKARYFINGNLIGEKPAQLLATGANAAIARHWWGTSTSTRVTGSVDNVRIYNRALADAEVRQLYDKRM